MQLRLRSENSPELPPSPGSCSLRNRSPRSRWSSALFPLAPETSAVAIALPRTVSPSSILPFSARVSANKPRKIGSYECNLSVAIPLRMLSTAAPFAPRLARAQP